VRETVSFKFLQSFKSSQLIIWKNSFRKVDCVTTQGENKKQLANFNGMNGSVANKQKYKLGKKTKQRDSS
jgi:hypothetical protein